MPAKARRWLDPMTGDYVVERGGPRGDDGHASSIVLRLRMHRGTCGALPTFGSRLHTIQKATKGSSRLAESYVLEALEDLIQPKTIRDVDVDVTVAPVSGGAALLIEVSYTDSAGDSRSVTYTSAVGA